LGNNNRRELAGRISTVLVHLLKLHASPANAPRRGGKVTVNEQRNEI